MRGEADADELGRAAAALIEELSGGLAGEARFKALMALAALRMAERERALAGRLRAAAVTVLAAAGVADEAALRERLRDPAGPLDATLHAALLADAVVRTAVTKPGALTDEERGLAGSR
jgi:hypothetical protein